jgi:SpoVK/Ycf46/Vps4 family AAA+-type ATPase
MTRGDRLKPVLERLLATRRAKVEASGAGAPRGLRVLFAGPSGRNRLLAAQLFAHELSVDLFQVDLERIVSKYLGDTEKNLDAFFQAAQASNAVLMLDESEQLFGASPSIDDSGRLANLDLAQLRRRLESYDGVLLLGAGDRARVDPQIARQCDEVVELSDD